MTADTITAQRLEALRVLLDLAADSVARLEYDANNGNVNPEEAAAIVNETIQNLVNEAR